MTIDIRERKNGSRHTLNLESSTCSFTHPFIHSDHFYSASSSPLLLRSAPDTARILCRNFTPKRHRQLRDLPNVPTWRLERDSNPRPSGLKASTLPMYHHTSCHCNYP